MHFSPWLHRDYLLYESRSFHCRIYFFVKTY